MRNLDLGPMRARVDRATPGPWWYGGEYCYDGAVMSETWCEEVAAPPDGAMTVEWDTNADLIAHAPTDLAALCDEVERLTSERADLREAFGWVLDQVSWREYYYWPNPPLVLLRLTTWGDVAIGDRVKLRPQEVHHG